MSETPGSPLPPSEPTDSHDRICGRCRKHFDADPTHVGGTIADWWLCDTCHSSLFGED